MTSVARFLRCTSGASAAEFALVLPAALLLMLGLIDTGRYAWNTNELEKAAQMGARYAVATDIVPVGLNSANYVGITCNSTPLAIGQTICQEALGTVTCSKPAANVTCTCANSTLGADSCRTPLGIPNATAFNNIAARIRVFAPQVEDKRISITYAGSGIGYAGDPAQSGSGADLSDVSPIVTVTLSNVPMRTVTALGAALRLPAISQSLTLEDGDGTVAY